MSLRFVRCLRGVLEGVIDGFGSLDRNVGSECRYGCHYRLERVDVDQENDVSQNVCNEYDCEDED